MSWSKQNQDKIFIAVLILISVGGILYFGFMAVKNNSETRSSKNPFLYNIDEYKNSGRELLKYKEIKPIIINMDQAFAIGLNSSGEVLVSGDRSITSFTANGKKLFVFPTPETARALAVDQTGDIYLALTDHVEVYDQQGNQKASWDSLGQQAILTSVAVTEKNVYLADAGNLIVWKYDKKGQRLAGIGRENKKNGVPGYIIPSPFFDVAVDPDKFLWAVNPGRHSLENYTPDGGLRTSWGRPSMEADGFCGCCNPSHFTILEDGSFVTSEKGIARVKIYNRIGNLVCLVAGPDQFAEGTTGLDLAAKSFNRIYVLDPQKKQVRIFEPGDNNPRSLDGSK